jgi:hypothetical protein
MDYKKNSGANNIIWSFSGIRVIDGIKVYGG